MCSASRAVIYTGLHMPLNGIFAAFAAMAVVAALLMLCIRPRTDEGRGAMTDIRRRSSRLP